MQGVGRNGWVRGGDRSCPESDTWSGLPEHLSSNTGHLPSPSISTPAPPPPPLFSAGVYSIAPFTGPAENSKGPVPAPDEMCHGGAAGHRGVKRYSEPRELPRPHSPLQRWPCWGQSWRRLHWSGTLPLPQLPLWMLMWRKVACQSLKVQPCQHVPPPTYPDTSQLRLPGAIKSTRLIESDNKIYSAWPEKDLQQLHTDQTLTEVHTDQRTFACMVTNSNH